MGDQIYFLITVFCKGGENLAQVALKVPRNKLTGDCAKYPMEPENKAQLHALLPRNMQDMGPIVDVTQIFSIHVVWE